MFMRYSHAGADSRARAMQIINGQDNGHKSNLEKLREIYENVRSGEMDFEKFIEIFES